MTINESPLIIPFVSQPLTVVEAPAPLSQESLLLQSVLKEFGFEGSIGCVRRGPVVTIHEFIPSGGVKMRSIIACADDIARNMAVQSCRIAVVPGSKALGIELPNQVRETVRFSDMLKWLEYNAGDMALPMAIGESIDGEPVVADLAKMPHLLVGGTTGSGKSVGLNTMILSLVERYDSDYVQFVMIDTKMLELGVYNGIPHLQRPVITDAEQAVLALNEVVQEMERRYQLMSDFRVRNIKSYNDFMQEARDKNQVFKFTDKTGETLGGLPIYEDRIVKADALPYIVVVIDEVADLMLVAGKDVEKAVQRLAQMARAAGIHLIMATQRPSVDVITGTIKANFPSRIAFQSASAIDSRTILGAMGAEKLLGMGDLLMSLTGSEPRRAHGSFISDADVQKTVDRLRV